MEALVAALEQAGAGAAIAGGTPHAAERAVVVKPTLPPGSERESHPLTYADPVLVEALAAWLADLGCRVTIGVSGPEGVASARAVGYADGAVIDLAAEVDPFHYGGAIGEHAVSRAWLEADARVLVGKARSDRQLLYAGALVGALAPVPDSGELARRFATPRELARCVGEVLGKLPVAFGVIDAIFSADGPAPPHGRGHEVRTGFVVASCDLLALDWVLGELLALNGPELCPVVRELLELRGPIALTRRGDLAELEDWRGPGYLRAALATMGAGRPWGALLGAREVPWTAR